MSEEPAASKLLLVRAVREARQHPVRTLHKSHRKARDRYDFGLGAVLVAVLVLAVMAWIAWWSIFPFVLQKGVIVASPAASSQSPAVRVCAHRPPCPSADSPNREAARVVAGRPEQGWSLLCNGVLLFEDTGELLPDGRIIAPHRPSTVTSPMAVAA